MPTIRIPTPLRPLAGGQSQVEVAGDTVRAALESLEAAHAGLKGRIRDERGELRRFVNVYLNDEDVRYAGGLDAPVKAGDVLSIVPAIAGGSDDGRPPTFQALLGEVMGRVREVSAAELDAARAGGEPPLVIDVREQDEIADGMIPGARHIPRGFLELRVENAVPDRDAPIVLYCAGGVRSALAAESLQRLGYRRVASLAGGFARWRNEGREVARPRLLSAEDRRRYMRHLAIPEVGEAGQIKLLEARVLLVGAGGLGSPAAFYLAAAGVGKLGILDFDVVDETNLQRQILHTTGRVGTPKAQSAARALRDLNPAIEVVPIEERLSSENVERIFEGYDIIVDGSDNFPTRYLVNDACVKLRKPNVHGSIYRFEGQLTVFSPPDGPCYRCLYPEPPPPELAPSCAEAGVLGVLPGVIGVLEAVEAIKLILGVGEPLVGRLLHYDALAAEFRELRLRRDPACAYCGDGKPFPGYVDYEHFCANPQAA